MGQLHRSLALVLAGLFACAPTETPVQESSRSGTRDGADDDDDEDRESGRDAGRDAGRRDAAVEPAGNDEPITERPEDCAEVTFNTLPVVPDMLIVLDRSGSMQMLGGVDRWTPSVSAVKTLTTTFESRVSFGFMMFPYANDRCGAGEVQVPIGARTATQIAQILDRTRPEGGTPTGETLQVARDYFGPMPSGGDTVVAPRYVLLVTDGQPTCPNSLGSTGGAGAAALELDKQLTIQAIDALAEQEVKTFVVGYDAQLDPAFSAALSEFAMHGGTERYFPVQDERSLLSAFESISSEVISCSFAFEHDDADPDYLRVLFDGKELRRGAADGWTFEEKSVTVQGTPCDQLKAGKGSHRIELKLACSPVNAI